jgi:hypothetical protein
MTEWQVVVRRNTFLVAAGIIFVAITNIRFARFPDIGRYTLTDNVKHEGIATGALTRTTQQDESRSTREKTMRLVIYDRVSSTTGAEVPVIGYAISITDDCSAEYMDAAAVLRQSIHMNSIRAKNATSKYDYRLYAFVDPKAKRCRKLLKYIGYEVMILGIPFNMTDVRNEVLPRVWPNAGCCGEKEFIKLYAYTLEQHPIVVHVDLDMIFLKPMDHIFDGKCFTTLMPDAVVAWWW